MCGWCLGFLGLPLPGDAQRASLRPYQMEQSLPLRHAEPQHFGIRVTQSWEQLESRAPPGCPAAEQGFVGAGDSLAEASLKNPTPVVELSSCSPGAVCGAQHLCMVSSASVQHHLQGASICSQPAPLPAAGRAGGLLCAQVTPTCSPRPAPLRHDGPPDPHILACTRVHDFFCMLALPKHMLTPTFAPRLLFRCSCMLHPSPDPKQWGGGDIPRSPVPRGAASGLGSAAARRVVLPEAGLHAAARAHGAATWHWVSAALDAISLMDLGCLLGWVELPQTLLPTDSPACSCCTQPWGLQCRRMTALSFPLCRFLGSPWSLPAATHRTVHRWLRAGLREVDLW